MFCKLTISPEIVRPVVSTFISNIPLENVKPKPAAVGLILILLSIPKIIDKPSTSAKSSISLST